MHRLRSSSLIALLALVGACAPMRPRGALSPISTRVTNEVIVEDAQTFDTWGRRVIALQQPGAATSGPRPYLLARTAAWLAYARDAYAFDPRDGVADAALDETRRLVVAVEHDTLPDEGSLSTMTPTRARPDLWAVLEQARGDASVSASPTALAEAEVALVRASRLASAVPMGDASTHRMTDLERACEMQAQMTIAERVLAPLQRVAAAPPPPAPVVVALQGEPVAPVRLAPLAPPAARRHGVERVVHFAVNSSELALQSRVTLGEVIAMLRTHPKVNLVIRGFTDPRGSEARNRDLAVRRAEAVRRFLDTATLDLGRVTMEGIGTDSSAAGHASVDSFARDRRVTLAFTGPDGEPLTLAAFEALDIDHEGDLQVEQNRSHSRAVRAIARTSSIARSAHR